ncbi:DUF1853 family protein [Winogradskyella tangerina]|uniref:DUF1853 family protein n=1 Tax=Winogradskyella tangerina TaxID=2023240 RepID=UPI000DBE468C|nr:DUF1853 family protein [Winogradskyella tangerina]
MKKSIDHKALFEGFQNTPKLWTTDELFSLKQFHIQNTNVNFITEPKSKPLRLGKWIEAYTSFQLKKQTGIEIISENTKINRDKQTIGELDFLFLKDSQPIHLEIAYKFYLFDHTQNYNDAITPWIGPNRNDSLLFKIEKLRDKQLPLLYRKETREVLQKHSLNPDNFQQFVNLKAQLYLPYHQKLTDNKPLNTQCIYGWHLGFDNLEMLQEHLFYIPEKLEWLKEPVDSVVWLKFEEAQSAILEYIERNQSPLCWIKNTHNEIQKCFITWW